jgi:hypothetical protein
MTILDWPVDQLRRRQLAVISRQAVTSIAASDSQARSEYPALGTDWSSPEEQSIFAMVNGALYSNQLAATERDPHQIRFAYVDYVTIAALQRASSLKLVFSSYDIACQYWINFSKRITLMPSVSFPDGVGPLPPVRKCIDKFHEAAHIGMCRFLFSFYYMPGAGQTDGGDSERRWAAENGLARSIREMSPGHRQDILNHHTSDYNVQKVFRWRKLYHGHDG